MRKFGMQSIFTTAVVSAVLALGATPAYALFNYTIGSPPNAITLTKVATQLVNTFPDAVQIGQAENFQTDDPLYTCLNGTSVDLWLAPAEFPGQTVVFNGLQISTCTIGTWVYDTLTGSPCLGVSTDQLDFGYVGPSGSDPQSVTVSNCGGGLLGVTGVDVGGDAADDYSIVDDCKNESLTAMATCTIQVVLTPSEEGPRPAYLSIVSTVGAKVVSLLGIGDLTAPTSAFSTADHGVVLTGTVGGTVVGDVVDNLSGVALLMVTYTSLVPTGSSSAEAFLTCDQTRRNCSWSVPAPTMPGVYAVTARSRDAVRNDELPGPTVTLIVA